MNLRELSHRLTAEVRPRSLPGRLSMIGFGLLDVAASVTSVMAHVINTRRSVVYALDQAGDLGHLEQVYLNDVSGLLYHIPFAVTGVVSAVIFFFPDRVGYAISFLALLCGAVIYWRWDSWSDGTRGPESLISMISEQYLIGGSIFTKGLLMLLSVLFLYEFAVLVKVLLSWRRS